MSFKLTTVIVKDTILVEKVFTISKIKGKIQALIRCDIIECHFYEWEELPLFFALF